MLPNYYNAHQSLITTKLNHMHITRCHKLCAVLFANKICPQNVHSGLIYAEDTSYQPCSAVSILQDAGELYREPHEQQPHWDSLKRQQSEHVIIRAFIACLLQTK